MVLLALMHGNEFAGAIVLDRLLRARLTPVRGRISFAFVNLAAFERFDPRTPTVSRFIDEDINRLWDEAVLGSPRQSIELNRAREIRPLIDRADVVLDLHSMLWPSDPLILCGQTERGRMLGHAVGWPPTVSPMRATQTGRGLSIMRGSPAARRQPCWWRPGSTGVRRLSIRQWRVYLVLAPLWPPGGRHEPGASSTEGTGPVRGRDRRGDSENQFLRFRARMVWRRRGGQSEHDHRDGRHDGDQDAVRQLPSGHA